MNKVELIDKLTHHEWEDFEVKEAKAEVPKSSWETVSAFGNYSVGLNNFPGLSEDMLNKYCK